MIQDSREGFTLMEVLIYVVIFSFMIGFLVLTLYQILDSGRQNRVRIEIESEASFAMQKIEWALNGAQAINTPPSNATSSTLSLNKHGFAQNPLVFSLASGTVLLSRGGGSAVPLLTRNVEVGQLLFRHVASSGTEPAAVEITLSVLSAASGTPRQASTTLRNKIYLR